MESYNSLTDPHLYGYFSSHQRKKALKKAGLIGKQGEVITEATYKLNAIMAEKGSRRLNSQEDNKLDELRGRSMRHLPKVNMPSEEFCREQQQQQQHLKHRSASTQRFQSSQKSSSYDRIKSAPDFQAKKAAPATYQDVMAGMKSRYPWSVSSPYLWPLPTPADDVIKVKFSSERQRCSGFLTCSALPHIARSHQSGNRSAGDDALRLSGTLHIFPTTASANLASTGNSNSIFHRHHGNSSNNFGSNSPTDVNRSHAGNFETAPNKRCTVTMHYYGDPIRLSELWSYRKDEIAVEQQHCGGNTLIVFRGRLAPGSDFSFPSMRHKEFPFSLTIYIEHQQNMRISVCCEAKHKKGIRLGGNNGCFGIVSVENPGYCESCSEAKKRKKMEKKAKSQKKFKASPLAGSSKKVEDDDDDDQKMPKESSPMRNRKKKRYTAPKGEDDYEDDFESESEEERPIPKPRKKENPVPLERNSWRSTTESEKSVSSGKIRIKKGAKNETEKRDEEEEEEKLSRPEMKQTRENPQKKFLPEVKDFEKQSAADENNEKRMSSKNKKLTKRKAVKNIDPTMEVATNEKEETKMKESSSAIQRKSSAASQRSRGSKRESVDVGDKPTGIGENLTNSQVGERRSPEEEIHGNNSDSNEREKLESRGSRDSKMSGGAEQRQQQPDAENDDSPERIAAIKREGGRVKSARVRSGEKMRKEYERNLRQAARECVEQIFKSLEEAMMEESDDIP